jgi:hypothetical protein
MRSSGMSSLMGGPTEPKMEKFRSESRELRMDAMQALHQILTSLHSSIVEPMQRENPPVSTNGETPASHPNENGSAFSAATSTSPSSPGRQNLVEIDGSKKKRRAEE